MRYLSRVLVSSVDRFYWDNGLSRAASLAYTTLLSLVPLVTLCLGFFASFDAFSRLLPGVSSFILSQFLPKETVDVVARINEFMAQVRSLNLVTIPFIVVTSILLVNSVEYALNQVWQVYESRSIPQRIAIQCAILVIAPVLAISAYLTAERLTPFVMSKSDEFVTDAYNILLPFFIDYIAFVSLYYLVPKAPVQFRAASFGAFFAAVLFNVAKEGFKLYIANSSYSAVYANLAVIPVFLFWLYLAWAVVLLGAEICYQVQYLPRTGMLWKRTLLSVGDGHLVLAVQSLVVIGRAFMKGTRLPNELELAEKLGCSSLVLKPVLEALKRADVLTRGDSHEMPLALKRNPSTVTLDDVRFALHARGYPVRYPEETERTFAAFRGSGEQAREVTLADLLAV